MGKDLFNTHLSKFSIRKLNIGVCSVLLSTLILLGTATQVSAEETSTNGSQNEISKADVTESPVISDESTTYEQVQIQKKRNLYLILKSHNPLIILFKEIQDWKE